MIQDLDTIKLKLTFTSDRDSIVQFIQFLLSKKEFGELLDKEVMEHLALIKHLSWFPYDQDILAHSLWKKLRQKHYPKNFERFLLEVYTLQAFGLVKTHKEFGKLYVKASSHDIIYINIEKQHERLNKM